MDFFVRLIPHGKIQPCLFIYDAFVVGKGLESFFPMIGTHAAFAKTAESHFTGGQMYDGIVNTSTAKSTAGGHFFCSLLVRGKDVQGKRVCHGI